MKKIICKSKTLVEFERKPIILNCQKAAQSIEYTHSTLYFSRKLLPIIPNMILSLHKFIATSEIFAKGTKLGFVAINSKLQLFTF